MKTKLLINPFERIAGWQAFVAGVAVMMLTAVVGKINQVAFDGVLDVHPLALLDYLASFAMQAVVFLALFLTMWLAGVCFSKTGLRAIDVAGTIALSRAPMLLLAVICFLPVTPAVLHDIPRMVIFSIICVPFIIWTIALMYSAYTVSCHLKGVRAVVSFIGALLVAEIISKVVFIFLLNGLLTGSPTIGKSGTGSAENAVTVADTTLTIRQKTEIVVKAFEQGRLEDITVYFDETMTKSLPLNMLKMAWMQTVLTCGKFEKYDMENLTENRFDKYDVVEVPFFFRRENRKLRLAFNSNGEISGLFFLKVNP